MARGPAEGGRIHTAGHHHETMPCATNSKRPSLCYYTPAVWKLRFATIWRKGYESNPDHRTRQQLKGHVNGALVAHALPTFVMTWAEQAIVICLPGANPVNISRGHYLVVWASTRIREAIACVVRKQERKSK